jgi:hypothetical protein
MKLSPETAIHVASMVLLANLRATYGEDVFRTIIEISKSGRIDILADYLNSNEAIIAVVKNTSDLANRAQGYAEELECLAAAARIAN